MEFEVHPQREARVLNIMAISSKVVETHHLKSQRKASLECQQSKEDSLFTGLIAPIIMLVYGVKNMLWLVCISCNKPHHIGWC